MREVILVRHGHAASNAEQTVSSAPPGAELSEQGIEEAFALREALAYDQIDLAVSSRLARTQQTLSVALGERPVPRTVMATLDEIHFGEFDGGPLVDYRIWAWTHAADEECPGGGESRAAAAHRFASALDELLTRVEERILVVSHALPIRYVIDASDGMFPASRIEHVEHAIPVVLTSDAIARAAVTLREWALAPRFVDWPDGVAPELEPGDLDRRA
ncbi:MAG: histidine phosphatase family protein [Gaiellales bacterium]